MSDRFVILEKGKHDDPDDGMCVMTATIRRAGLLLAAMLLGGTLLGTCSPAPAAAQEIEPQTFPLRIDMTEVSDQSVLRVYTQCGQLTNPLTVVQGGVITTFDFPIVRLCDRGLLLLSTRTWNGSMSLDQLRRYDREGLLGGVLLCFHGNRAEVFYYGTPVLPFSCAEKP